MRGDSRQSITSPSAIHPQLCTELPTDGNMLVIFGHMCFSLNPRQSQMAQERCFNVQHIVIVFPMYTKFLSMAMAEGTAGFERN